MEMRTASESVGSLNSVGPLDKSPEVRAMSLQEVCERIETVRNSMDQAINLVGGNRELWCRLDRIDRDLRQLKRDIGFPNAGLKAL